MHQKQRHLLELCLSTFLLGFNSLFAKLISWPAESIIWGRGTIAVLSLLIFALITKKSLKLKNKKNLKMMIFLGVLYSIHWVSFFMAIQVSTVAIAMAALFTYPVLTALAEPLFFKEKYKVKNIVLAAMMIVGMLFMVEEFSFENSAFLGILWGLLSSVTYVIRNLFTRKYVKKEDASTILFYQVLMVMLTTAPFMFVNTGLEWSGQNILFLLILGSLNTAFAHTLYVRALMHFKAREVGVIASLTPIYSTVLAIIILKEIPSLPVVIGGGVILLTVLAETYSAGASTKRAKQN